MFIEIEIVVFVAILVCIETAAIAILAFYVKLFNNLGKYYYNKCKKEES